MESKNFETVVETVRNLLLICPVVTAEQVDDVVAVLRGEKVLAKKQAERRDLEPLMKPAEAAKLLGISTRALMYLIANGAFSDGRTQDI